MSGQKGHLFIIPGLGYINMLAHKMMLNTPAKITSGEMHTHGK